MDGRSGDVAVVDIIKTEAWKRKRAAILRRDQYKDQLALREGKHVEAQMVHHIFPREQYPEYALADWNLISISYSTHGMLHDKVGRLTNLGKRLQIETAEKNGIPLSTVTMVIGRPGTGKTTWVQMHLGAGIAYDLDYIAAAFRLTKPHAERHKTAEHMANTMLRAFVARGREESAHVYVIRTAPTIDEIEDIQPDEIVLCEKAYHTRAFKISEEQAERISDAIEWANANGIRVIRPE